MRAAAALPAGELRPARGAPRGNLDVVARGKDEGSWRVVGQSPDDAGDWQRSDLSIGRRGGAGSIAWAAPQGRIHRLGGGAQVGVRAGVHGRRTAADLVAGSGGRSWVVGASGIGGRRGGGVIWQIGRAHV